MSFPEFVGPQTITLRKEVGDQAATRDPNTGDWVPASPSDTTIVLPNADIQFGPFKEEGFGSVGTDVQAGQAVLFAIDPVEDSSTNSTLFLEVGDVIVMDDGLRTFEYEIVELTNTYDWLQQELGEEAGGKEWLLERRGDA